MEIGGRGGGSEGEEEVLRKSRCAKEVVRKRSPGVGR